MNIGNLTKKELIKLANDLLSAETEEESDRLCEEFNRQFSHPNAASLFFYPEDYNARKMDISNYSPSVEEVVEKALAHKPIQL